MAEAALVTQRESALARLDPQALISKALETGAGIETMERLVALAKDVRQVQAKEAWYEAMAAFQRKCPAIKKTKEARIATRSGPGYTYRYAPLDEILSVVQPVMGELGLSVSWSSPEDAVADKVVISCRISHTLGHHEDSGPIAIPIVQGDGTGATPPQRVGIAATYAKRYALLSIIGLAPEDDDDGKIPGETDGGDRHDEGQLPLKGQGTITEPQQKRFWAIAREHAWSEEQIHDLLAARKIESTKEIPVAEYETAIERLKKGPKGDGKK